MRHRAKKVHANEWPHVQQAIKHPELNSPDGRTAEVRLGFIANRWLAYKPWLNLQAILVVADINVEAPQRHPGPEKSSPHLEWHSSPKKGLLGDSERDGLSDPPFPTRWELK